MCCRIGLLSWPPWPGGLMSQCLEYTATFGPGSPTCCHSRVFPNQSLGWCVWSEGSRLCSYAQLQGRLAKWISVSSTMEIRPPNSYVRNLSHKMGQMLNRQKRITKDTYSILFILWLFLNFCRLEQNNHNFSPFSQLLLPCPSAAPWRLSTLNLRLLYFNWHSWDISSLGFHTVPNI